MRSVKKIISILLSITIILSAFSVALPVFAAEAEKEIPQVPSDGYSVNSPGILYELTEDRTANTKSFMQSDGTKLIVQYEDNVHFENSDGELVEYDNTLSEDDSTDGEKEYKTKASDIDIRISKKTNSKKLVRVTKGNDTLSWNFDGITKVTGKVSEKTADEDASSLENFSSEVIFSDVFEKTDLQYIISGDYLKENIILNSPAAPDRFIIGYKHSGLTPELSADKKTIYLKNSKKETVFVISAPFMTDSGEEVNTDLYYELGEIKNNQFTATLVCDTEWLEAENRAYPVTVDPVIVTEQTWDNADYQSAYVSSYLANSCFGRGGANYEGSLYAGYEYTSQSGRRDKVRSLIRFSLPALNKGDRVVGAKMLTYLVACYPETTVNLYKVTSGWTQSTVTWNTQPTIDSVISEYNTIPYTEEYEADFVEWDITKLVDAWYLAPSSNYGIMLKSPAENSTSTHRARFLSSGYTSVSAARPFLAISVRNMSGFEDYYSYSDFGLGTAGTASVNNFTGNLVLVHTDMSTSGVLMPVSVSGVYNTSAADGYPATYPHMGYGKKLSVLETVKPSSSYGLEGESATAFPYAYEDGDGTVHYFYKTTEDGDIKYYDEDGLDLELTFTSSEYTITDKNGNKKIFDKSDGKIKKSMNADGVAVLYEYNEETLSNGSKRNYLSQITDGAGHIISFTYNKEAGTVTRITGPDGKTVNYTYSNGYNTNVTYADGTSSTYTFSSGLLSTAKSADGYQLDFTYSSDGAKGVASVTEKSGSVTGQQVKITRDASYQTEIRSSGADRSYGNSDDIKTTYQFDTYGRVTSAKSALGSGEVISYGSYDFTMGAQNNATDIKKRNRLESASAVGKNAMNLLNNHSFEVTDDGNWGSGYWLDSAYSGTSTAEFSTEEAYLGQQSAKINVSSAPGTGGYAMYQNAHTRVQSGKTYTASLYVKTDAVTKKSGATTYGAGFVVRAVGSSGTTSWYSDMLTGTTAEAVDNGWQRLEVTFTTPAGLTSLRIMPMIYCATGTAYFDCVQLEEGDSANHYNLLKNSDFELSSSGWHTDNGETADAVSTAAYNSGSKSFLLSGNTSKAKALRQTVGVSANENDTYIVSGFAKATASPCSEEDSERLFAISVKIVYTDGTSIVKYPAYFNYAVTGWQHASGVFTLSDENSSTQKTPKNVTVYYNYKNQTNACYFDDLSLIKDPVATYKYDSDGNLISAVENAEKTSSLTYDANDNLTALQDEKNVNYTYTYSSGDNKHQLTSATDSFTNIKYNFTYNNNGSLTVQNIESESGDEVIKTEIIYSDADSNASAGAYLYRDKDAHGRSTYYYYDTASGLLDSVKDANGKVTEYTYYQNNGLLKKAQNGSSSVSYVYDSTYTRLTQISRTGGSYGFTYDSFGNTLSTSVAGIPLITNTYASGNGLLQTSTYGNSDIRTYTYDAPGRLIGVKNNNTNAYSWTYSGSGVPNSYTDNISGRKYRYTYDSLGRIISQTGRNSSGNSDKTSSVYTYDISNNLTKLTTSAGAISLTMRYYYDSVNRPTKSYYTANTQETYTYDALGRLSSSNLKLTSGSLSKSYVFYNSANYSGKTTNQIKDENIGDRGYRYTYDRVGNITAIKEKTTAGGDFNDKVSYTYDSLNQLTRENNKDLNKTITYTYDTTGNITSVKEHAYTTGTISQSPTKTITYTYDGTWKDKLVNYNGQAITYDSIGNPLTYRDGMTFSWFGRQMESANVNGTAITYKYNADGMRTQKTVGSTVHKYEYTGDKLFYEKRGDLEFYYRYDAFGNIASISRAKSDGTSFALYTVCNARGDVEELRRSTGELFARYVYDSWGNVLHIYDANGAEITSTANLAVQNPFRYRGYYYDNETGLYYLQSRYYDPVTCRFLNADGYVSTGQGILGCNMFAYCGNNPVSRIDPEGQFWITTLIVAAVVTVVTVCTVMLSGCSSQPAHSSPRSDLANAPDLDVSTASPGSYNCYGNGIGKQINANPTGYNRGDSTRETFESVKNDLGRNNVRELSSIIDSIRDDEFKVALKCGPSDYHFIRLDGNEWYNKSGTAPGLYIDQSIVAGDVWYAMWMNNGQAYMGDPLYGCPYYNDETIYFAVKVGWDTQ